MYLRTKRVEWRLLNENDDVFVDLYNVTDNLMKQHRNKGMGVIRHSTPISHKLEEDIWIKGVLGKHEPKQLCNMVLYLVGVNFALRGVKYSIT